METAIYQWITLALLALIFLALAGIFILLILLPKRFRRAAPSRKAAPPLSPPPPPPPTPPKAAPRETARGGVIAEGIRKYAAEFDGLYEGLYQSAHDPGRAAADAYEEWCDRAARLPDAAFRGAFAAAFSKEDVRDAALYRKKSALLLEYIAGAGITRDRGGGMTCDADETLCRAYVEAGRDHPKMGFRYTILKSAWLSGEKVVEYGMVMPGMPGA